LQVREFAWELHRELRSASSQHGYAVSAGSRKLLRADSSFEGSNPSLSVHRSRKRSQTVVRAFGEPASRRLSVVFGI
jgi:plasmid stability protein